jgi:hypothetical protein
MPIQAANHAHAQDEATTAYICSLIRCIIFTQAGPAPPPAFHGHQYTNIHVSYGEENFATIGRYTGKVSGIRKSDIWH